MKDYQYMSNEEWQNLKAEKGDDAFKTVGIQCISGANRFKTALNNCGNRAVDAALRVRRKVMYSAFLGEMQCQK